MQARAATSPSTWSGCSTGGAPGWAARYLQCHRRLQSLPCRPANVSAPPTGALPPYLSSCLPARRPVRLPALSCSCPSLQRLCLNGLCGAYAWSFNATPSQLPPGAPPPGFPLLRVCQVCGARGGSAACSAFQLARIVPDWAQRAQRLLLPAALSLSDGTAPPSPPCSFCSLCSHVPLPALAPPGGRQIQSRHGGAGHRCHQRQRRLPDAVSGWRWSLALAAGGAACHEGEGTHGAQHDSMSMAACPHDSMAARQPAWSTSCPALAAPLGAMCMCVDRTPHLACARACSLLAHSPLLEELDVGGCERLSPDCLATAIHPGGVRAGAGH